MSPCKEYESLELFRKMEMETYAQYTYSQNKHLQGGVSARKAKELAKEAMAKATEKGKQMSWHRENCPECKAGDATPRR